MVFLIFLAFACLILSTPADPCHDNQHCSKCDPESGNCIGECEIGYYDLQCTSHCSKNCKQKKCKVLESTGIGKCTEGCEPGFHGENCNIICSVQREHCSKCPGGCDGEYCTQGNTCFSGCQDSYYGSACKDCSRRCQSCNRISGTCDLCHSQYYGKNCEYSCKNCSGSCDPECARVCASGLYGTECAKMCNENCLPNPVLYSEEQCFGHDGNIANDCTPECHSESGECIHGCMPGWYGTTCEIPCNYNCINKLCTDKGACEEGCTVGHFGKDCKPCPDICSNYTCVSSNGSCLYECSSEVYEQFCNMASTKCIEDVCAQITDQCLMECSIIEQGCTRNCSTDGPTTECSGGICVTGKSASGVNLYAVSLVAVLFVAVSGCCIWYRRGRSTTRINHLGETEHGADTPQEERGEYETLHRYAEIQEADMDMESETSSNQEMAPGIASGAAEIYKTIGTRYISRVSEVSEVGEVSE